MREYQLLRSPSGKGRPHFDMSGEVFGRLTVMHRCASNGHGGKPRWHCKCECGREVDLQGYKLRNGGNKSCGCFRRDRMGGLYRTHGLSKTIEYKMFYDARKRAAKLGLPFSIVPDDILVPAACPVLGIALDSSDRDHTPSLDKIIPAKGYTPENICVISFKANRIKSDASLDELILISQYIGRASR